MKFIFCGVFPHFSKGDTAKGGGGFTIIPTPFSYGVTTYGTTDASLTVGLGFGFVDDEFADKPMVVLGGEKRISRRLSFVPENWILPGVDDAIISYGVRFFGEKLSVDLALVNMLNEHANFYGFPYIDFVFNF